jgi:hypothetical protein
MKILNKLVLIIIRHPERLPAGRAGIEESIKRIVKLRFFALLRMTIILCYKKYQPLNFLL